jgi:hypothetical protein
LGPDELRLGSKVLISFESAARWRAMREAQSMGVPSPKSKRQRSAAPSPAARSEIQGDEKEEDRVSSSGSRKP